MSYDTTDEQCMMGHCKSCPGKDGAVEFLQSHDIPDEVQYKQWVTTDRTTLLTITQPRDEYIDNLADLLHKLTRHSYVAKSQSDYTKFLKNNITAHKLIIQGDFAENYSFVNQDEIQSFHWEEFIFLCAVYHSERKSGETTRKI